MQRGKPAHLINGVRIHSSQFLFLSQFDRDLVSYIESVSISNCSALNLNLSSVPPQVGSNGLSTLDGGGSRELLDLGSFTDLIDVEVSNVDSVELTLRDSERFLRHLFMDNVAYVETFVYLDKSRGEGGGGGGGGGGVVLTTEELYLYIIIVLGALLLITWIAIPIAIACAKRGR